ncbi:MAG: hypothetical protein FWC97_11510 [Treponema sp.]|nr:hypothetical protein [Treponema sp.]
MITKEKFNINMLQNVKPGTSRNQFTAKCPAHDDKNNSLSVRLEEDKTLLYCFAGCTTESIVAALGLSMSSLFNGDTEEWAKSQRAQERQITRKLKALKRKEEHAAKKAARPEAEVSVSTPKPKKIRTLNYRYLNADGSLAYRKERYEYDNGSKSFCFFNPEGEKRLGTIPRVLYNLPAVLKAEDRETVYIVEGEKAADAIISAGRIATTLDGGANSPWHPQYAEFLKGKSIFLIPDIDEAGQKYVEKIVRKLPAEDLKNTKVAFLTGLPESGDICDWFEIGRTIEDIENSDNSQNSKCLVFTAEEMLDGFWEKDNTRDDNLLTVSTPTTAPTPQSPLIFFKATGKPKHFIMINPFANKDSRAYYSRDDIGLGYLFADTFRDLCRPVPETKGWFVYTGVRWKYDTGNAMVTEMAKHFVRNFLWECTNLLHEFEDQEKWLKFVKRYTSVRGIGNLIASASTVHPMKLSDFDQNPNLINCLNGQLNSCKISIIIYRNLYKLKALHA